MSEKRFVVQEDANTEKIILLIDYKRMNMYSFLAEEREAVQKICDLLNELSDENGQLKKENERLKSERRNDAKELRYVRKGYTIWDTYSDREVQELNYRSQSDYMCEVLNEKESKINTLVKENEQLRKEVESSETTSNTTSDYNAFLESKITTLEKENKQLRKQIQNYEQLIDNSYVGEEETLDGWVGKYVIFEDELQKYKNKNEMIDDE